MCFAAMFYRPVTAEIKQRICDDVPGCHKLNRIKGKQTILLIRVIMITSTLFQPFNFIFIDLFI